MLLFVWIVGVFLCVVLVMIATERLDERWGASDEGEQEDRE